MTPQIVLDTNVLISALMYPNSPSSRTVTTEDYRDPKDNQFLNLALSASCQIMVSGDADLRTMSPYQGISIISPSEFLALLKLSSIV